MIVEGSWYGDHKEFCLSELLQVRCEYDVFIKKSIDRQFSARVDALFHQINSFLVDIEPNNRNACRKFQCYGQSNVTEADNCQFRLFIKEITVDQHYLLLL